MTRGVDLDLHAIETNYAGIGLVRACDDLYQRRFARAIVSRERHDLGWVDFEVHLRERFDGAKMFRNPLELQNRNGSGVGAAPTIHPAIRISNNHHLQGPAVGIPLQRASLVTAPSSTSRCMLSSVMTTGLTLAQGTSP